MSIEEVRDQRVCDELRDIRELRKLKHPAVGMFGSARYSAESSIYHSTQKIAKMLAESGFSIVNGGGPGMMKASTEGARLGGGKTIGLNIALPFEEPELKLQHISLTFEHFFTRKLAFASCSDAFVVMPGGMGTLDELFDVLTLMQTGKIERRPIAFFDKSYWTGLLDWLEHTVLGEQYIVQGELSALAMFDDESTLVDYIVESCRETSKADLSDINPFIQKAVFA